MPYVPHSTADIRSMLAEMGRSSVDELFAHLPAEVRLQKPLALPPGLSEEEVRRYFSRAARANHGQDELVSFLGGGVYDAIIPAVCDALVSRSEFLTAYTPYQPEVSQGTLQAIYEWQSFVCRLTGMDVANASMYDGATALAEALSVLVAARRKQKVVLPATLNPRWRRVVLTTMRGLNVEVVEVPVGAGGTTDPAALAACLADDVAACVVANPNYLGLVEPVVELGQVATTAGVPLIAAVNPVSLAVLKAPSEYGAALTVGEAQPLGVPACWGGPLLGFLACTETHKRRIPGRIVGRTQDNRGNNGYVLTLQTREQHIRREKATSNICSNQGLNVLRATIYLSMLGAGGLAELGEANLVRCAALRQRVARVPGVSLPFTGPVFNEFVIRLEGHSASAFRSFARDRGVLAGIPLAGVAACGEGDLLVAVTEKRTAPEIARYGDLLAEFVSETEVVR